MIGLAGFLFGNWQRILVLLAVLVGLSVYMRFQFVEAALRETRAELADARDLLAAAEAQADLNQVATNEADISQREERRVAQIVADAQAEITYAEDAHALYVAWVAGVARVRNDEPASA